jgi:flagellar biosynthesis protein FlhG
MISILSGKGGVGKTVVAFNLAERLNAAGLRVLLVDCDFACGNSHILANVRPEYGLGNYLAGQLSLKEAVTAVGEDFDILTATGIGHQIDSGNVSAAAYLAEHLQRHSRDYDAVVLDHSSGICDAATVLAHASDVSVLVVLPELMSLSDSYGLYKYLTEKNSNIDCRLYVNRVQGPDEAEYIRRKFCAMTERFLRRVPGYLGHLMESEVIRKSVAGQLPVCGIDPDSAVAQQLTAVAQRLTGTAERSRRPLNEVSINNEPATADIKE